MSVAGSVKPVAFVAVSLMELCPGWSVDISEAVPTLANASAIRNGNSLDCLASEGLSSMTEEVARHDQKHISNIPQAMSFAYD